MSPDGTTHMIMLCGLTFMMVWQELLAFVNAANCFVSSTVIQALPQLDQFALASLGEGLGAALCA
ncbi:hypothetical protein KSC_092630 [Ktedonobacter sp. SOSP1-52]|nr:hypothetical protein KSC_092630 [Ktedonobacter sp. SOSP1-52]